MLNSELIGMVAGFITTSAFVPQVIQVLRTREVGAISLLMYVIFSVGLVLWFFYGLLIGSWPIIIYNVITLMLSAVILFCKLRFR